MSALRELGCPTAVTGYLMCTDNMPSGTAMALGDVLTIRGGTTVEVINTDAEGRLVMADALVLATEEADRRHRRHRHAHRRLHAGARHPDRRRDGQRPGAGRPGPRGRRRHRRAGLAAAARARATASELDSTVADLKNLGGANAGAITAALFLAEFVGDVPWAHIDIAGTAQSTGDAGWQTAGCTGFGARLLAQLAIDFTPGRRHRRAGTAERRHG